MAVGWKFGVAHRRLSCLLVVFFPVLTLDVLADLEDVYEPSTDRIPLRPPQCAP